jgi:hypothetical protein
MLVMLLQCCNIKAYWHLQQLVVQLERCRVEREEWLLKLELEKKERDLRLEEEKRELECERDEERKEMADV